MSEPRHDDGLAAGGRNGDTGDAPRPPWHFWVGVAAGGIYLAWRAVEGFVALF